MGWTPFYDQTMANHYPHSSHPVHTLPTPPTTLTPILTPTPPILYTWIQNQNTIPPSTRHINQSVALKPQVARPGRSKLRKNNEVAHLRHPQKRTKPRQLFDVPSFLKLTHTLLVCLCSTKQSRVHNNNSNPPNFFNNQDKKTTKKPPSTVVCVLTPHNETFASFPLKRSFFF